MKESLPACSALFGTGPDTSIPILALVVVLASVVLALFLAAALRPMFLLRTGLALLTRTFYRLSVFGREHVPATGAALLVCNHVTYIDWLLLLAPQPRGLRFVMWTPYARRWGIRQLLRWARVISINEADPPKSITEALHAAADALAAGELVCLFAEGMRTRTDFVLPFHRCFEQIVQRTPAPIVPVCLDHVWGSIFSYFRGRVFWKWPIELPYPVSIAFGPPLPATSSAAETRLAIQKLSADCAVARDRRIPVHRQFIRSAARHPFRPCLGDSTRPRVMRYCEILAGSLMTARRLRRLLGAERMVGLWLPPSIGGAIANIALAFIGKTSVNLNYTLSADNVQSAVRQCGLKHVITSERFLAKMPLDAGPGVEVVSLEALFKGLTKTERFGAILIAAFLPAWLLIRWLGLQRTCLDEAATIIFSSGSTGEPKGVVLTHRNIAANVESMIQAIDLRPADRVLGVLPFFHSFGYTVTLWAPLQMGASSYYHPDPRQAKEIGEICRKQRCTIFLTTPTFLRFCLRRCEPGDFQTLRILMCGAEKLPPALAQEFHEKFGVDPLEGYGCTELSPAAAANMPDRVIDGTCQVSNKRGTIGQPLPGVAAKIVHPESFEPLPPGQEGLLLIYGANVMQGYLGQPELTAQVLRDGWYVTGDIGCVDADGFITLTGRLSRFAKVGGEMVPLERLEDELQAVLGTNERVCAVAAVPDEKRGERVVVLHLPLNGVSVKQVCDQLGERGLPNLWVPGERDFFQIGELPILGSGKLDLKRLKDVALERTREAKAG